MKIQKTITLNIEKTKTNFICHSLNEVNMLMGTVAVSGNFHIYGIKKSKNTWIIPISKVKERIQFMEQRKKQMEERLDIMKQLIK